MPTSIRFKANAERVLERWVDEGLFETKADAVRAALNLMDKVIGAKAEGNRVLIVPAGKAKELVVSLEL